MEIRIMAFRYHALALLLLPIDNLNLTFTAVRPRCIAANRLPLNLSILVDPSENLETLPRQSPYLPRDNFLSLRRFTRSRNDFHSLTGGVGWDGRSFNKRL